MLNISKNWLSVRDPWTILEENPTWLFNEVHFYVLGSIILIHACRNGTFYMWLAIVLHGLNTELISYWLPDINNFWHSQATIQLVDGRAPLHIILCVYPILDYIPIAIVERIRLPLLAKACAVGFAAIILDMPYEVLAIKLLWFTYHDTDPNMADRMYSTVSWTTLYFHATSAFTLVLVMHGMSKAFYKPSSDIQHSSLLRQLGVVLTTGLITFWLSALQFLPYNFLHDLYAIHTEVCVFGLSAVYFIVVLRGLQDRNKTPSEEYSSRAELVIFVVLFFVGLMATAVFARPQTYSSTGFHEPFDTKCTELQSIQTLSGTIVQRRKFLCLNDYEEPFDVLCSKNGGRLPSTGELLMKPPKDVVQHWYTICGTAFEYRAEFISVVWSLSIFGISLFSILLFLAGQCQKKSVKV